MIKFRLVELGSDGYIIKEFYNSSSFPGNEYNEKFKDAIDECLYKYGHKLNFLDKKFQSRRVDIHINHNNQMWRFYLDAIKEYKRRRIKAFKGRD